MFGALLGAAASIGSSILGSSSKRKAEKANLKAARENAKANREQEERNYQRQKEFAKSGIQWRAADAAKAGIHPLAALGAQTSGFSGYVGDTGGGFTGHSGADYSALAQAGQDLGAAIDRPRSPGEKLTAYAKTVQDLTLTRMGLENELLSSQVAKVRSSTAPGIPSEMDNYLIEGQNVPGTVTEKPMQRTMAGPGGYREPGSVSDIGYAQNAYGGYSVIASDDVKRRIEDSPEEWIHYYRNNIHPWFDSSARRPPPIPLKYDHHWSYDPVFGYYQTRHRPSYEHQRFRETFYRR